ncbi:hypothetical protein BUALT_Bualt16G0060900 [Buddleja alternifolia]|uniref:Phosphotransferase n=1 Tax=Buddleja alternifolia TaxID=168488 RepID=A0AAV6WB95_9LAMI|nr:hypothetical protein BUALT_Bualt16G0060900 [Buddleja alternifolia]
MQSSMDQRHEAMAATIADLQTQISSIPSFSSPHTPPPPPAFSSPPATQHLQNTSAPPHLSSTPSFKPPKLDMQTFDGTNPLDWIFQAEQYFVYYHIPPDQRLDIIPFYMKAGGKYNNPDVTAAVILAWVRELMQLILNGHKQFPSGTVINIEWGNFGSSHLPLAEYDQSLDAEKIVRRVLCRMAEEASLFGDNIPPKLKVPFILRTPDMSAMLHDSSSDLKVVGTKLKDILEVNRTR